LNLSVRGIHVRYGDGTHAVRGVDLDLQPGTIHGLVGDNGSGKTSLLSVLARLRRPTAGTLGDDDGERWSKLRIGWMASEDVAIPETPVDDYLRQVVAPTLGLTGRRRDERLDFLIDALALRSCIGKRPGRMSRGQRIRAALVTALLERPDLVLLDEPFLGLDPDATERTVALLRRETHDSRTTLLVSDHRLDVLGDVCDLLGFLVSGRLVHTMRRTQETDTRAIKETYRRLREGNVANDRGFSGS
jgi:ABC-2 type transport system ATP-binding protein